jgi:hypothetical protein
MKHGSATMEEGATTLGIDQEICVSSVFHPWLIHCLVVLPFGAARNSLLQPRRI